MTYKQISETYNIPYTTIVNRVFKLKLKGVFRRGNLHMEDWQVEKIIEYQNIKNSLKNNKRKITIIEFYLKHKSRRKVAYMLNLSRESVEATVREFETDGCITIESSSF